MQTKDKCINWCNLVGSVVLEPGILFFYNFYSNGINMHRCQYNTVQSFNDYKREAKRTCVD